MATSSPEDAPHGMEFIFSRHRLNVATSRPRCVCILVGTPLLFEPECRTAEQMRMQMCSAAISSWRVCLMCSGALLIG
jgi:uncharacterized protein